MRYFILIILVLISSCGFHLRSTASIQQQYQPVYINTPVALDPIYHSLKDSLLLGNIVLTETFTQAQSKIEVVKEEEPEQTYISSTSPEESIYILRWHFNFFIRDLKNPNKWQQVINNQTVSANTYLDPQLVQQRVGDSYDSIQKKLRYKLANLVIRQISFTGNHSQNK